MRRIAQAFDEAALVDKNGPPACAQIRRVHRHDDLGSGRTGRGEQISLVRTDTVFQHESGIDDRRQEKRLGAMFGIAGIDPRDVTQIEDAAGGSAVQRREKTYDAVDGQYGTNETGGNKSRSLGRFDEYWLTI